MSRDEFPPPMPPPAVDIVPFDPEHAQGFAALVVDTLREFGFEYDPELDRDLDDPGATYAAFWIALVDGDVVGSVALRELAAAPSSSSGCTCARRIGATVSGSGCCRPLSTGLVQTTPAW